MNDCELLLRDRFAALLDWEKSKRRESILIAVLFWSLVVSLPVLLARRLWGDGFGLLFVPLGLFLLGGAAALLLRPWSKRQSLRSIFLLDRSLKMEDRALTAWDILEREQKKAAEQLVLEEAAERLATFDPRVTFKRNFSWHGGAALALLVVWILGALFTGGGGFAPQASVPPVVPVARALKDFLQPLEEKAELQNLSQSLELARALREIAEKVLQNEISEETFRDELGHAMNRLQGMNEHGEVESSLFPVSRSALEDLGAEIAELKRELALSQAGDKKLFDTQVREKLGQLPRLEQALQKSLAGKTAPGGDELDSAALQSLLERLEAMLQAQMERLTQEEMQEFLASILGSGQGDGAQQLARDDLDGRRESGGGTEKKSALGKLPGDQPGEKSAGLDKVATATRGGPSQVKGALGEGERTRIKVRSENRVGASKETIENVPAGYQRQVERDLASEEIPDGLKDTIKKYFLSLGGKGS
ncbi:MAG: hypothetical protein ACREQW_08770 [Candidatus Binatia bacterium]